MTGKKKETKSFGLSPLEIRALELIEDYFNRNSCDFTKTNSSLIVGKLLINKAIDLGLMEVTEHVDVEVEQ